MTRDELIREASIDYQLSTCPRAIGGDAFADMAHYIDKDALVAELDKLEKKNNESENVYDFGTEHALKSIRSFIKTLEVKEVDLDSNITPFFHKEIGELEKIPIDSITIKVTF